MNRPSDLPSPHDVGAEAALLGQVMTDATRVLDAIDGRLTAADFYRPDHGRLFALLVGMYRRQEPIDLTTVADRVMREGRPDAFGGLAYVLALPDRAASTANVTHYARAVRDHAVRRRLLAELSTTEQRIREGLTALPEVVDGLSSRTSALLDTGSADTEECIMLHDAAAQALGEVESVRDGQAPPGAYVPLRALRAIIPTWTGGDVHVIAARPRMGKSVLALQCATACAGDGTSGVLVFSLEMDHKQVARRRIAGDSRVAVNKMHKASDREIEDMREAVRQMQDDRLPVAIFRGFGVTVERIAAVARRQKRRFEAQGIRLAQVVIDYLQLVTPDKAVRGNESESITVMSRAIKLLAGELGVPIILLSQLNRECEKRQDKRPIMSDLRGSGAIEQDASSIIFVHREIVYDQNADPNAAELLVRKCRDGGEGVAIVRFDGAGQRFYDPGNDEITI